MVWNVTEVKNLNNDESDYDEDTDQKHIAPSGMEHQTRRNKGKGSWYATIPMRHFIIKIHQDLYPELAEKMKNDPTKATNIYSAFLARLPIMTKRKLTAHQEQMIYKAFNLMK